MDVLLAHAFFLRHDRQEQRVMRPHPPLGLLYLSAYLKSKGVDVGVFDSTFARLQDFNAALQQHRPRVVGIGVNLMTKIDALAMMATARAAGAWVVLGGPEPPPYADEYLQAGAHVIVIGEGEQTLEQLLPILLARPPGADIAAELATVSGVAYAGCKTAPRTLLPNLDQLPFPDRGAVDLDAYLSAWRSRHGFAPVSLVTARGCPYTCTWCSHSVFGFSHRRRSPGNVADEVELIIQRHRPDRLWYADDVFAIHREWTLRYAAELQRRRLRLPFECISRAERLDDEVADALADMGCWRVWIGSESGSQPLLDRMQRRVAVDRVAAACALLRRRGIQVGMFIMLGYDGERDEDLQATVRHLKRTAPDVFLTTVAYPIKGTPYFDQVASRVSAAKPWAARTDRDFDVADRPSRSYYWFARRWVSSEVARHAHWRNGRYVRATRAATSAAVGRIGMRLMEGMR
jgi:anaerobic magnesium-protoporphyrin IX monomethyl ester cyclase